VAGVNEPRRHGKQNKVTALHEVFNGSSNPFVTEVRKLLVPDLEQIMEAVTATIPPLGRSSVTGSWRSSVPGTVLDAARAGRAPSRLNGSGLP
jgi:hypothetical protein